MKFYTKQLDFLFEKEIKILYPKITIPLLKKEMYIKSYKFDENEFDVSCGRHFIDTAIFELMYHKEYNHAIYVCWSNINWKDYITGS